MRLRVTLAVLAALSVVAVSFGSDPVLAQVQLPTVTHSGPTRISVKTTELQQKLAGDIEKAKAKGADVAAAEKHKTDGDTALSAGNLRIAIQEYQAGEEALPKK